jgi:3-oxoacyl-[acyl-carrier protein] reductase
VWDRCKHEKPEQYAKVLTTIPFGRFGTPDEVAQLALFLASPLAGWITGQIMAVDGGQSLRF